jgi:hypothetical protein
LLTHPPAAGYTQNPISVYYCYGARGGRLERCIAEVTNTPWAERVTFLFRWVRRLLATGWSRPAVGGCFRLMHQAGSNLQRQCGTLP